MSYPAWGPNEISVPEIPQRPDLVEVPEVPSTLCVLPDVTEGVVIGDVERWQEVGHLQGRNSLGFEGTCGLVSVEQIARMAGLECTEDSIVRLAAEHSLCAVSDDPARSGGTTPQARVEILQELGVPAHIEEFATPEEIAGFVEEGRGTIVRVNAGTLWDDITAYDGGQLNHAIVVTGVARDPENHEVKGFFINDSGSGKSGQYVNRDLFEASCPGYLTIVTDIACV